MARVWQRVVTTPEFRAGQNAAWEDFRKDPDSTPNVELLARLRSREFAAGYTDEWEHFIAPVLARRQD
jgi:hypothetical protein